jgi:localization factor PodJL
MQIPTPAVLVPTDGAAGTAMLRQPAVLPNMTSSAVPGQEGVKLEPDVGPQSYAAGCTFNAAPAVLPGALATATARPHGKAAILGTGAAVLMLFAVTLTLDFYRAPADPASEPMPVARVAGPETGQAGDEQARGTERSSEKTWLRQNADLNPPPLADGAAPAAAPPAAAAPAATAAIPPADGAVWDADGLIRHVPLPAQAGRDPWPQSGPSAGSDLTPTPLPPAIGSKTLIAAAQAGDPGASYEIAIRFAQGRNAAPDFARSAAWLERAAQAGLAPAQFRLGSMYEKGLGVRKDFAEARRLYMAAATKGHAKAMHNLAVLYTRGIDGAADYGAAVEWFRKAAAYGTVDSAYNLGILYARGAGVERDLVESYKWFALAAKGGDKDAAHKRDEVAKGLDPAPLESAKASAETFVAVPQPDEATSIKAPAGGWDQVAAAATTKSRTFARPERFPGR